MAKLYAYLRGIIALLGDRMYSGDPVLTAIKELLQNSYDAIKMQIKDVPSLKGRIEILTSRANRTIKIIDNGCGMTKEVVESAFFGIGCSHKEGLSAEERSGGFGAAKVQFLTFPKKIHLRTVKNGICTECSVTREQLLDGKEFDLTQFKTAEGNGTCVVLYIGEKTMKGDYFDLRFPYISSLKSYLPVGNLTVHYVRDSYYGNEEETIDCSKLFEYPFVGTAEACFGKIDIYMGNLSTSRGSDRVKVYSAGIKQFEEWYGDYEHRHAPLIINVRPCVDAHNELYPINNQRQGWSAKVAPEIKDLYFFLEKICNTLEARKVQRLFSASTSTMAATSAAAVYNEVDERNEIISNAWANFSTDEEPATAAISTNAPKNTLSIKKVSETRKAEHNRQSTFKGFEVAFEEIKVDTTGMSLDTAVIYNNTDLDLTLYNEFLEKLGAMLIQFRNLVHKDYSSLAPSDQFWGIALDKAFLGVRVKPSLFNFIGINPFGFPFEYLDGVNYVNAITEQTIHIILHELAHNSFSGHGDSFCSQLCSNYGAICGLPWFNSWKTNLKNLISTHAIEIAEGSKAFKKASNIDSTILEEEC